MTKMLKSMPISLTLTAIIMLSFGCTSGTAQTKGNDYSSNYQSEDFEAFDSDDVQSMNSRYVKPGGNSNSVDSFYQRGLASWYGREFHGKTTASGEKFDMNELSAAHKTLPFGTIVEVKNLDNGKIVCVRINDRGPYRGSRIIDLSHAGAKELDMVKAGEANVELKVMMLGNNNTTGQNNNVNKQQYVEPVSDTYIYRNTKSESKSDYNEGLKLQAGAFISRKNAENLKSTIEMMTDNPVRIVQDGNYYKVRIENIKDTREMNRVRNILSDENIPSFPVAE
jgi:rare lipoprotein A